MVAIFLAKDPQQLDQPACVDLVTLVAFPHGEAFFRGSHTTNFITSGFSKSYNQAAEVPSSNVTCTSPRSPYRCKNRGIAGFACGYLRAASSRAILNRPDYNLAIRESC